MSEESTDSAAFEEQLQKDLEEERQLMLDESKSLEDTDSDKYFGKSEYEEDDN